MGTSTFLDLLLPQLGSSFFAIAIDKWGTGTWDFGHINATKYVGPLRSISVDDSCDTGGSWKATNISARFPEGTIPQTNCGMFGESFPISNFSGKLNISTISELASSQTQVTTL